MSLLVNKYQSTYMTYDKCCNYFKNKFIFWNAADPHFNAWAYIIYQGKEALVEELRSEDAFMRLICPFLAQYARGIEKETTSTILKQSLALLQGNPFQIGQDLLVAAVLEACGYQKDASNLERIAICSVIAAALGMLLYSALPSHRKKKRRKG